MTYRSILGTAALVGGLLHVLPAMGLDEADTQAFPFPPGEGAALVKSVCASCHEAGFALSLRYDQATAERYYRIMVSENLDTDEARTIIRYLTTVLGK